MKIEGEHLFEGPVQEVWDMFYDPNVLATAIPGMDKLDQTGDDQYEGVMNVRVGPVSGKFQGKLNLSDVVDKESLHLSVDGRGAPGYVNGAGNAFFTDNGDGTTLLKYEGDVKIGGALASVGQRMIDSVAKSMIRTAFGTLDKTLAARIAARAMGENVDEVKVEAATQADFAKNAIKDVFSKGEAKEDAPKKKGVAEFKMLIYIIPLVIILIIAAVLLSK